jgi:hypothetical protein
MADKIVNYYNKLKIGSGLKKPKNYNKHLIEHNSHILVIGKTGTGKTNWLMNYLSRSNGEFSKIIIFTGSTTQEPLYKIIQDANDDILIINDMDELPELDELEEEDDEAKPKLIVFDDFINLTPKELKRIFKYIISSRKYGCSCIMMAQDYKSVPKLIVRNVNYIVLFRINDNISINNIIRNHNINNIDKDTLKQIYLEATEEPLNFLTLDFKTTDIRHLIRRNFIEII